MKMNTPDRFPFRSEKTPFATPEGYFDGLTDRVMLTVTEAPKTITWYQRYRYAIMTSAAVLMLGFGLWWSQIPNVSPSPNQDEIEYYLTYQQYLNTHDLVHLMEDDIVITESIPGLNPDDIEEYLLLSPSMDLITENENIFE